MKCLIPTLFCAFFVLSCDTVPRWKQKYIPIYVTPFFESEPLGVDAGPYSEKLMSNSRNKMLALGEEFRRDKDNIHIIPMAILAVRLYDLGLKDEACYWYYTFQLRRNIVRNMLEDTTPGGSAFELIAAADSFKQLSGQWINGYSFGDPDKTADLIEKIIEESRDMGYIAAPYEGYSYGFKPESEQQHFVESELGEMAQFARALRDEKEEILRKRKENGIEGKY